MTAQAAHDDLLLSFIQVRPVDANFLGAPLLVGNALDNALEKVNTAFARAVGRLHLIHAHDALKILQASLGAPKLNYMLRSSPCAGHSFLADFDSSLRQALSKVINVDLSDDQWFQASLPVRPGGLGVRSVALLAPSAFLASAASTLELQDRILCMCVCSRDSELERINCIWHTMAGPDSLVTDHNKQSNWDRRVCQFQYEALLSRTTGDAEHARLLALCSPRSGDWLKALPLSSCGLRLDDDTIRVTIGLHLGARLCEPHGCPCGSQVDSKGLHGLSCKRSAGRTSRHNFINDVLWRAITKAGVPAIKEPAGLSR